MRVQTENYLIYLIIGIIPWTFFTTVINQGMVTVRINAGIIKKVYFPREILPISVAVSGLINFLISCIIILLFCIFGGVGVSWHIIFLPLIAIIQFFLTLGIAFALSAINVYIKDTEYLITFFINMLFYATPILYEATLFPESIRFILYLNPMTQVVEAYRNIFLYHQLPNLEGFVYLVVISIIILGIGLLIFRKLEKGFAEEV